MSFTRFRPTSHFIAPHSWSNDPCGAVYVPETQEYLFCYQWNPGTHEGGNSAWGMAKSKDLVTWEDCTPPIKNGITTSYDSFGVFSGSIVSRLIDEKRVLFLFYTSVAALPIHWSKEYLEGCESQSVAFSTDFGRSWHRYESNPLLSNPPKKDLTTGWRDPFVSRWPNLSRFLNADENTDYMMIASGEKHRGSHLHLYSSNNLLDWDFSSTILDVQDGASVSPLSAFKWGKNFECASFFSIGERNYITIGVEENIDSKRHNGHCTLWLCGDFVLENGKPKFKVTSHGTIDAGILYAIHLFRDAEDRLLQLGWADESANPRVVKDQGWAGCLGHPREFFEISRPISITAHEDIWNVDHETGTMTTLGIRPARQVSGLRSDKKITSLREFSRLRSDNFEVKATFKNLNGSEKLIFNVRQSPSYEEVTKIIFDIWEGRITVDRRNSSLQNLGTESADVGDFRLLSGEDLKIHFFVDNSVIEVFANDRFALTSRIYPSLSTSVGASYYFGGFDSENVEFHCWEGHKNAWPLRKEQPEIAEIVANEYTYIER
ncbi:glycosyl hydrolase [Tricladium varicosporioides]|nr:glycosyl hydrolase [Hymenoscyphus varicosporioides]